MRKYTKIPPEILFKNLLTTAVVFSATVSFAHDINDVEWVSSSPDSIWNLKTTELSHECSNNGNVYYIYSDEKQQRIDGVGGCFNELGWDAIQVLDEQKQQEVFDALFNDQVGCEFSIFRIPLGANDYSVDWYSHNETKDDFDMSEFSIDRDRKRLIPYIQKAKTYNPHLRIWASPWCPPSWMKVNDHYACYPTEQNQLPLSGQGKEMETQFRMTEDYLNAYALYFSKFIESYSSEGIDIYAVHVQNEPNSCQNFPSCVWHPNDLATFVGDYLGPKLEKDFPKVELFLGTIERPQIDRVDAILGEKQAKKYIDGVGFQWAGKGVIPYVKLAYPELKLIQTETECGNGSNDWAAAEYTYSLMNHYFNHGANTYLYWNMVLNETGKSQWGWKQNSMISIDSSTKVITYNPEYYLMKHFSRYITPGAYKIGTSDEDCLAFQNEDTFTIIFYNSGDSKTVQFCLDGSYIQAELAAQSFNTFRWKQ